MIPGDKASALEMRYGTLDTAQGTVHQNPGADDLTSRGHSCYGTPKQVVRVACMCLLVESKEQPLESGSVVLRRSIFVGSVYRYINRMEGKRCTGLSTRTRPHVSLGKGVGIWTFQAACFA